MTQMDYIVSAGLSMPMFIAAMCAVLLVMLRHSNADPVQRRLVGMMIATYAADVLCWFGMIMYTVDWGGATWLKVPFFATEMLTQVLLYRFIFAITGIGSTEKFPRIHYIIPAVLTTGALALSLTTPMDVQYYIISTRGGPAPGYEWFARFSSAIAPIFVIYFMIYPLLGLIRTRRFRRAVINYSADEQRSSVGWMYSLIFLIWAMLPVTIPLLFVHRSVFFATGAIALAALLPICQYVVVCYNLMAGNYVIIESPESSKNEETAKGKPKHIDRRRFDAYMQHHKPWLDPKLRITDLCLELGTNRSYLSGFINNEFGVNFSRYINRLRLEELDRMRLDPQNRNITGTQIVQKAGFSSYHAYLRVKKEEDSSRKVAQIFE